VILDGKQLATQIKLDLQQQVRSSGIVDKVGLAVVLVGDDFASQTYVNNKVKACNLIGIQSVVHKLPATVSQNELIQLVEYLNNDDSVHGILVQLPLPCHIETQTVINHILYTKDVDGLGQRNVIGVLRGYDCLVPCTPQGIIRLVQSTGIDIKGKHAVVVGRSDIVGRPIAQLLLNANATVTVCHSHTVDMAQIARTADILIVAVGKSKLVDRSYVKCGAVVVDVGINRVDNKLCGDVDFDSVVDVAGYITPVPGGVGPMTIAMLMHNVLKAYDISIRSRSQI
jgi:methylenetetrahydrofolate dehydrogenase (NADP+)/methenyltetrahydrofolate cyclohydrolase